MDTLIASLGLIPIIICLMVGMGLAIVRHGQAPLPARVSLVGLTLLGLNLVAMEGIYGLLMPAVFESADPGFLTNVMMAVGFVSSCVDMVAILLLGAAAWIGRGTP